MANKNPNTKGLAQNKNLTPKERRNNASKAGKASVESRKKRKTERELAMMILEAAIADDDDKRELSDFGITGEEATYYALILVQLIKKALKGDIPAIKELRNIIGTDNAAKDIELRKEEAKRRDKELEMKEKKFEEDNW